MPTYALFVMAPTGSFKTWAPLPMLLATWAAIQNPFAILPTCANFGAIRVIIAAAAAGPERALMIADIAAVATLARSDVDMMMDRMINLCALRNCYRFQLVCVRESLRESQTVPVQYGKGISRTNIHRCLRMVQDGDELKRYTKRIVATHL